MTHLWECVLSVLLLAILYCVGVRRIQLTYLTYYTYIDIILFNILHSYAL